MNIRKLIEDYIPFNEQEEKDKITILKYIDTFDDVLTRNNEFAHFTSSAFIVNQQRDKVLMIHHNIFNSWTWVGGHADGEDDFLAVAIRETEEETGIKKVNPLTNDIFVIDTLPVLGHVKRGKYVSAHIHLSVAYLFEVDDTDKIRIKEDENSGVKWIPIDEIVALSSEQYMKPVYQKIIAKLKTIN